MMTGCLHCSRPVSYTHLRAHETDSYLVCRLLLEKKKKTKKKKKKDFLAVSYTQHYAENLHYNEMTPKKRKMIR